MKFKKVAIVAENKSQMRAIAELFNKLEGATMADAVRKHLNEPDASIYNYICIEDGAVVLASERWVEIHGYRPVKFSDIHQLLALNPPIEVKLNASYTAKVTETDITVGCQTFPIAIIDALVKARDFYKNQ